MFHTRRALHIFEQMASLWFWTFFARRYLYRKFLKKFYQLKSYKWEIREALSWPNCYVTSQQNQKSDKHVKYVTWFINILGSNIY